MNIKETVDTLRMDPGMTANKMIAEFAANISKQHRTHQASIIRNLAMIMVAYSQQQVGTDDRNKGAVELCNKIKDMDFYIPYI